MTNTERLKEAKGRINRRTIAVSAAFLVSMFPAAYLGRTAGLLLAAEAAVCLGAIPVRGRRIRAVKDEWQSVVQLSVTRRLAA